MPTRKNLRDADIPPVPESLTSRINALIAEDTVSGPSGASEDRPRDERKGSIISLAGRRLSSRSLAKCGCHGHTCRERPYMEPDRSFREVWESRAPQPWWLRWRKEAVEETAAARELEAVPETAAAEADAAPAPAALQESPEKCRYI